MPSASYKTGTTVSVTSDDIPSTLIVATTVLIWLVTEEGPDIFKRFDVTIETSPSAQPFMTVPSVFAVIFFCTFPRSSTVTSRYCCLDEMVTVLLLYLLHVIVIGTRQMPSPSTYSIFSISATAVKSVLDSFSRILRFADAVNVTVFFPPSVSEYFPFEVR